MTTPEPPRGDGVTPAPTQFTFPAKRQRHGAIVSEEPVELAPTSPSEHPPEPVQASAPVSTSRPQPSTPSSSSNPDYVPLDLLSGFRFYSFKELYATQIRGRHQAKFALAHRRESTRLVVEAVTSLLGDGIDAKNLTISDFYAVLYWLRLNCYSKGTFTVTVQCTEPDHVLKVVEKKLPPESLKNTELISATSLREEVMDQKMVDDFLEEHKEQVDALAAEGFELIAPVMADSIELEEKWVGKPEYDEVEFLTDLASSITPLSRKPMSLTERLDIVGNLKPHLIGLLREWQDVVQSYGIEESISLKCKGCGAEIRSDISISAHDFL